MSSTQAGKCIITQYMYVCLQVWVCRRDIGDNLCLSCLCTYIPWDHAMLIVYAAVLKFFWSPVLHVVMSFIEKFSLWYTSAPEGGGITAYLLHNSKCSQFAKGISSDVVGLSTFK